METPRQDDVERLLEEADYRSACLYPAHSRYGLSVAELATQCVRFFVARLDGCAIGCGGYLPGVDNGAELKRMFVSETARGKGVGRAMLETIEKAARQEGVQRLQLETGVKSIEALGLYRRLGYHHRGPFGRYQADPLSVFMEKPSA